MNIIRTSRTDGKVWFTVSLKIIKENEKANCAWTWKLYFFYFQQLNQISSQNFRVKLRSPSRSKLWAKQHPHSDTAPACLNDLNNIWRWHIGQMGKMHTTPWAWVAVKRQAALGLSSDCVTCCQMSLGKCTSQLY